MLAMATTVFLLDKPGRIRQIEALLFFAQGEKAEREIPLAHRASTYAFAALACEGVEPIVDGDLRALTNILPCIDVRALAHRIRLARVIQVAAGRQQDCASLPIQLAEMSLLLLGKQGDIPIAHDLPVATAKNEFASREIAPSAESPVARNTSNHSLLMPVLLWKRPSDSTFAAR